MQRCPFCDIDFEHSKWHPSQKYCSVSCANKVRGRIRRGFSIKPLNLKCLVCDQTFVQKRLNNKSYCSHRCKKLASSRKSKGINIKGPIKHIWGTGYITKQGYRVLSRKHPNASKRGQILEHILIMSQYLERALEKHETVHHKNGIRNDNRIENLELWSNSHPFGQRVEDKISWCKEFLEQYDYVVIMKEKQE